MSETTQSSEGNTNTAVAKTEPQRRDYRLGLFDTDKFLNTPKVSRVFGVKEVISTDKNGNQSVVGFKTMMPARRDLAQALDLEGKENKDALDREIEKAQTALLQQFKAWLIMQPDNAIGITRYAFRKNAKSGIGTHSVTFRELPDRAKAELNKLADAYGIPVEKLAEFIASLRGKTVEVEATVTGSAAAGPAVKPTAKKP